MVWNIGDTGAQLLWSLEIWVKGTVMLSLYLRLDLQFLVRLAIMVFGFSDF